MSDRQVCSHCILICSLTFVIREFLAQVKTVLDQTIYFLILQELCLTDPLWVTIMLQNGKLNTRKNDLILEFMYSTKIRQCTNLIFAPSFGLFIDFCSTPFISPVEVFIMHISPRWIFPPSLIILNIISSNMSSGFKNVKSILPFLNCWIWGEGSALYPQYILCLSGDS